MGVADRDWYSDRRPPGGPDWPPRRRGWNPVVVAAAVVALFFVGMKVDRWLTERVAAKRQTLQSERARFLNPPSNAPPRQRQVEVVKPQAYEPPPARVETSRTITRCIFDGRVFYVEDGRCTLPQTATGVPDGAYGSVPGLTTYQREMLRSADARIARDAAAARADTLARQQASVSNRGECAAIDEAIRGLDSAARQPLSGYQQDSIRQQRQSLTSRKFQIGCR